MRIYQDDEQKMNRSLLDVGGSALVISQFTLAADLKREIVQDFQKLHRQKMRNYFIIILFHVLSKLEYPLKPENLAVKMLVDLINDGPVTICLDTDQF